LANGGAARQIELPVRPAPLQPFHHDSALDAVQPLFFRQLVFPRLPAQLSNGKKNLHLHINLRTLSRLP
jgi:hypothetical protein